MNEPRWWVINGDVLQEALRRAHEGEDPDALYIEYYANSEVEQVPSVQGVEAVTPPGWNPTPHGPTVVCPTCHANVALQHVQGHEEWHESVINDIVRAALQ